MEKQLVNDEHWEKTGRELIILRSIQSSDRRLFTINGDTMYALTDERFKVLLDNARIYFQDRYMEIYPEITKGAKIT